MSVQIIERRYCDVCEREYEADKPDWMILSAPNAPEDVDAAWDFCSYACLTRWISEDELDDAGPDFGTEHDVARTVVSPPVQMRPVDLPDGTPPPPSEAPRVRTPEELAEAQKRMDAAMKTMSDKPPMSLMEALASGELKFDRSGQ